jgi:muramoyltetrapeptide carboxypeptidase
MKKSQSRKSVPAKASRGKAKRPASAARTPAEAGQPPRAVVGVVAPSAPAPLVELAVGAERLQDEGFEVYLHPQVKKVEGLYAGSDAERALAFLDYAFDPDLDVVWAARGGYGAIRILPILDEIVAKVGRPEPKTLVGFSDLTILLEYARTRWGWRTIHGPMPATFHIERVRGKDWKRFVDVVAGATSGIDFKLRPVFRPESFSAGDSLRGPLVGGNLALIQSAVGTPYAFNLDGKILFLEEIGEAPYRMDRMVQQLLLANALRGVRAIVLGTFTDCGDSSPRVYAKRPSGKTKPKMQALRKLLTEKQMYASIFGELGETLGIPVFSGLPVGHGAGPACFELGVEAELNGEGRLRLP